MITKSQRRSGRAITLIAIVTALLALLVRGAAAQADSTPAARAVTPASLTDSALDAQTRSLAAQLRCPVCQGLSIQDSPSELSQQMRSLVRQQLASGKSPDEVKQYFVARYGEWILMEPPAHGFNWLVYALPALMLVLGITVLFTVMKRWTGVGATVPTEVASGNADVAR